MQVCDPDFISSITKVDPHKGLTEFYKKHHGRCSRKPELKQLAPIGPPENRLYQYELKFYIDHQQIKVHHKDYTKEASAKGACDALYNELVKYVLAHPDPPKRSENNQNWRHSQPKPLIPFKPQKGPITNYRGKILDFYNQNRSRCDKVPLLELKSVEGPAHDRRFVFVYTFWLDGKAIKAEYRDRTKKSAMRECSVAMYIELCKIVEKERKKLGEVLDPAFVQHYHQLLTRDENTNINRLEARQAKRKQQVDVHPVQALQRFANNKTQAGQPAFHSVQDVPGAIPIMIVHKKEGDTGRGPSHSRSFTVKCEMFYDGKMYQGIGCAGSKKRAKMDAAQCVIDQVPEAQRFVASMRRRRERERNPPKGSYHHHHPEYQKLFGIAEDKYQQYSNYCQTKEQTHPDMANHLYNEYSKAFKQYKAAFESHNKRQQTAMRLAGVVQRPSVRLLHPIVSPNGQLFTQQSPAAHLMQSATGIQSPQVAPSLLSQNIFQQQALRMTGMTTSPGQISCFQSLPQAMSPYGTASILGVSPAQNMLTAANKIG